jgi:hypothetical protein
MFSLYPHHWLHDIFVTSVPSDILKARDSFILLLSL